MNPYTNDQSKWKTSKEISHAIWCPNPFIFKTRGRFRPQILGPGIPQSSQHPLLSLTKLRKRHRASYLGRIASRIWSPVSTSFTFRKWTPLVWPGPEIGSGSNISSLSISLKPVLFVMDHKMSPNQIKTGFKQARFLLNLSLTHSIYLIFIYNIKYYI